MGLLTNDQSQSAGGDLRTKATDRGPFPAGQGLERFFQVFGGQTTPQPPPGDHDQDNRHFKKSQDTGAAPSAPVAEAAPQPPQPSPAPPGPEPEDEGQENVASADQDTDDQGPDQGQSPDDGDEDDQGPPVRGA